MKFSGAALAACLTGAALSMPVGNMLGKERVEGSLSTVHDTGDVVDVRSGSDLASRSNQKTQSHQNQNSNVFTNDDSSYVDMSGLERMIESVFGGVDKHSQSSRPRFNLLLAVLDSLGLGNFVSNDVGGRSLGKRKSNGLFSSSKPDIALNRSGLYVFLADNLADGLWKFFSDINHTLGLSFDPFADKSVKDDKAPKANNNGTGKRQLTEMEARDIHLQPQGGGSFPRGT